MVAAGLWSLLAGRPALIWALALLIGSSAALATWPSRWTVAAFHGLAAGSAATLLVGTCTGCMTTWLPIIGVVIHAGLAIGWIARPAWVSYPSAIVAGSSMGMALFAWVFGYLCGPCFAVHAIAIAVGWSIMRQHARIGSPDRTVSLVAVPVAVGAISFAALVGVPSLARNPDERRIIHAMQSLTMPVQSLGQGHPGPTDAGLPIGKPEAPIRLDIVLSVGCPLCASEIAHLRDLDPAVADGRIQIRLHLLPGTQVPFPEDMAASAVAAIQAKPAEWLATLTQMTTNDRSLALAQASAVMTQGHAIQAQMDRSAKWAVSHSIIRSPTTMVRRPHADPSIIPTLTPDIIAGLLRTSP